MGRRLHTLCLTLLLLAAGATAAATPPKAAVASAHPLATAAGREVLAAGGNAFDAAVAVSAALAVVEPYSSGLGGGGFWLLHTAAGRDVMVDGRERAPLAADRTLYQDEQGNVIPGLSMNGPLAAGIPGEPAALAHIARDYGRLPLAKSLAPAIRHARDGFEVTPHYRRMAGFRREVLLESEAAARTFLADDEVPPLGHVVRQPDLAETLRTLAEKQGASFYRGELAKRLVDGVRAAGGIWSREDLAAYEVVEREPVRSRYRGLELVSATPPSSGGVALATMLNILSGYDLADLEPAARVHLTVEAMRRAYRDRAEYLGDPDFVDVPVERLTHPHYAAGLRASINQDRATPSADLPAFGAGGADTTHFSVLDGEGNYVAATLSINYPFGSGFMVEGTGVLLNDEMDDFSAKPGVPNAYGLVGAAANAIEPGKRMLSSMSPTFLRGDDRTAVFGTPGGSRIITMVLLGGLEFAAGGGAEAMVRRPRFHHQYLPDTVFYEPEALDPEVREALRGMGHRLEASHRPYGNMQAVVWDRAAGRVEAASDPRGEGAAAVFATGE